VARCGVPPQTDTLRPLQTPKTAWEGCQTNVPEEAADRLWLTAHVPWMPKSHIRLPKEVIDPPDVHWP
jgi:hypothetical protein